MEGLGRIRNCAGLLAYELKCSGDSVKGLAVGWTYADAGFRAGRHNCIARISNHHTRQFCDSSISFDGDKSVR
jgi:hypothetical protein